MHRCTTLWHMSVINIQINHDRFLYNITWYLRSIYPRTFVCICAGLACESNMVYNSRYVPDVVCFSFAAVRRQPSGRESPVTGPAVPRVSPRQGWYGPGRCMMGNRPGSLRVTCHHKSWVYSRCYVFIRGLVPRRQGLSAFVMQLCLLHWWTWWRENKGMISTSVDLLVRRII